MTTQYKQHVCGDGGGGYTWGKGDIDNVREIFRNGERKTNFHIKQLKNCFFDSCYRVQPIHFQNVSGFGVKLGLKIFLVFLSSAKRA